MIDLPLTDRKNILKKVVKNESEHFVVSLVVEKQGVAFYAPAKQQDLEGIVAK